MTTEWQTGLQAFREGRMREAVDRLQAASHEDERTVSLMARFQTYAFLGAAQYALGRASDAVGSFEAALRLSPTRTPPPDLTVNLANAYLAVGRRSDARQMLQSTVQAAPGHIEARMLLQRLSGQPEGTETHGMVLGESPSSVKQFLRSLVFKTVPDGGYDPAQVRQAFLQIERYVDFLIAQVAHNEQTQAESQQEIARLQQSEDTLVQNMLQAQQEAEHLREQLAQLSAARAGGQGGENVMADDLNQPALSPLEKLFQRKG